ncbi:MULTISPECIES: ABC transporter ATP-binding protein [Arthrobacter]|uniref:ABC transporter ATP-binding protein n=1 Tax=Arthrobacter TaxID=1663 RepID=UPI0008319B49|nr:MULTISPECIES: ATP-binding cassette domain-containing protein [Arthrobacter]UPO76414.1 ATP-binding cassette domain-containing protein [Arthrobacter sp. Helios]
MNTDNQLIVEGLTVQFGGVKPLNDVSLEFVSGVCGLIGPNGAGKTTFFNVLSGFAAPVSGRVRAGGVDLLGLSAYKRAKWGLRRTFQQEQVIHTLSGWENILVASEHTGSDRESVEKAIRFTGLTGLARPGSELTMMERRLVEMAKAVCGSPRIVVLDEPAAGLDVAETQYLTDLIARIPEEFGALVVLVDHDMDLVSTVCSTTAVLDFGKRIALGPTLEVLASAEVKRAYLGTADVEPEEAA